MSALPANVRELFHLTHWLIGTPRKELPELFDIERQLIPPLAGRSLAWDSFYDSRHQAVACRRASDGLDCRTLEGAAVVGGLSALREQAVQHQDSFASPIVMEEEI